jgi:hypothetical protein
MSKSAEKITLILTPDEFEAMLRSVTAAKLEKQVAGESPQFRLLVDVELKIRKAKPTSWIVRCRACGEYWPCTVQANRKAYSGYEAAKHGPDMDEKMKADMSQEYSMGANRHEP